MEIKINRSFEKDTDKIKDKLLLRNIAECIEQVQNAKTINQIRSFKRLKGFKNYYRIRLRDYRIGILVERGVIEFVRFLHRKDIYKYFPQ